MEKKSNNFMKVHAYIFNKIQSQSMDKFCFLRSGMISFQSENNDMDWDQG